MNEICIVVADAKVARFFGIEAADSPRERLKLVEQAPLTNVIDLEVLGKSVTGRVRTETNTNRGAGPVHPIGAQRERHRIELERRFGREIVSRTTEIIDGWPAGTVVLVAEPRMLGLVREPLRKAMQPGMALKELAKNYTQLTAAELHDHLAVNSLVPARRAGAQ